ncbi:MAG: hypothetical protein ACON4H_16485 [Rubripirellula sp.]
MKLRVEFVLLSVLIVALARSASSHADDDPTGSTRSVEPCEIEVIDRLTGWPVPMIEIETTNQLKFVSDNSGRIAFDAPELMGTSTWLHVRGHGYSVPKDGFGYRGVRVKPEAGGKIQIVVDRDQLAMRLGRLTGAGIYAESQKLGYELDWKESGVMGCDSVQNATHLGNRFWAWGDTNLPSYPLGRFHMTGATTLLSEPLPVLPPVRVAYQYFRGSDSVPRNLAEFPGDGPTWLTGLVSIPDQDGIDKLVACYSKIRPPMTEYERGLCVWNEQAKRFDRLKVLWRKVDDEKELSLAMPTGHACFKTDEAGARWVYFGDPLPTLRCKADYESWSDPSSWITLQPQATIPARHSNDQIAPHRGAMIWHPAVEKWVSIFTQYGGDRSFLGEIWLAIADDPEGPWRDAVKVAGHEQYTFYNPQVHPVFHDGEQPVVLFEATYTKTFSKTKEATPRWDYNQVLYRVNIDDVIMKDREGDQE